MFKYVVRRLLLTIPILFAIVVVTFGFSYALPGGPFDSSGQRRLPEHVRAQLEERFNLQKPLFFNLPNDGKGSDTAWGETLSIKGHSDTGYRSETFPPPQEAGIKLYGEYQLVLEDGQRTCLGANEEPGWALVARREVCKVTGGNVSETFTEIKRVWRIDLLDAQFWIYMGNILTLDFGPSLNLAKVQENKQVIDDFRERVPVSMQLGIFSTLVGFGLGIPLGVIAAIYHNQVVDYGATFIAVIGQSIPSIVLAPMLIIVFAVRLEWLPVADPLIWKEASGTVWQYVLIVLATVVFLIIVQGFRAEFRSIISAHVPLKRRLIWAAVLAGAVYLAVLLALRWIDLLTNISDFTAVARPYFSALLLPVLTIGTGMSAGIARLTRATLLQVLNEDYIRTARAKGLRERGVIYIHALKNSLIPVVTGFGGLLAGIVSGSFVVELIFSIPGMGVTFIDAVNARDYTTIMGVTIFYSTILILGNILVDIMYTWLDPRIRFD